MIANTAAPTIATQLGGLTAFATAPTATELSSAWEAVERDVFKASEDGLSEYERYPTPLISHTQLSTFRDATIERARNTMDARIVRYAENRGHSESGFVDSFEMLGAVMRGRALGLVSRGSVDAMERFYKEAGIAPSTKRVQGARLLIYRARLRALLERKGELKSLARETGARPEGIRVPPKEIPADFAHEVGVRQLKAGAIGVGMVAAIEAVLGGVVYMMVPDVSNPLVPLIYSYPAWFVLLGWISMHRGILTERF